MPGPCISELSRREIAARLGQLYRLARLLRRLLRLLDEADQLGLPLVTANCLTTHQTSKGADRG